MNAAAKSSRPRLSDTNSGCRLSIDCPHCGERARVRSSRALTLTVRSANLQCSNVECGHTFGAQLHITHTIAPSQTPNPDVALPKAPPRSLSTHSNDNCGAEVPLASPA
jgi:hypothetical protein